MHHGARRATTLTHNTTQHMLAAHQKTLTIILLPFGLGVSSKVMQPLVIQLFYLFHLPPCPPILPSFLYLCPLLATNFGTILPPSSSTFLIADNVFTTFSLILFDDGTPSDPIQSQIRLISRAILSGVFFENFILSSSSRWDVTAQW